MTTDLPNHDGPFPIGAKNANPVDCGFWALVAEDFRIHNRAPLSQGFWALFWHRFGNWRMGQPRAVRLLATPVYLAMFKLTEWVCGIHLPYPVRIGRRVRLEHFGGMILVPRAIGDECTIRQNTTMGVKHADDRDAKPIIGRGVDIGAGAVILGAVTVGDGARIGANAVVIADVPPGATAVGVPARVVSAPLAKASA